MRATQSNCCGSLNFLSPEPCPQQPWAARIITRFRQSYSSVIMSREWKTLKKSRSDWLDCTDTAVEWKMRLLCFPVLPGSAEAHVIWGGTVKHVLIACFISNICAKKYQNTFTCIKVIANQRWDGFWDTVYNDVNWFQTHLITAALRSRYGHYIFIPWFLLSSFYLFSSPNLSGRRVDTYYTTRGMALVRI